MGRLADALEGQGKHAEAALWFRMALDNKRRILGAEHPDTIDTLENYGNFLRRTGNFAEARAVLVEAMTANRKLYGERHEFVGYDRVNLGLLYYDQSNYLDAETEFRAALSIYEQRLGADNVLHAGAQIGLARALTRLGAPQQSVPLLETAIRIADKSMGPGNAISDTARAALGIALLDLRQTDKARMMLEAVRTNIETTYGASAVITREVATALARLNAGQAPRNSR